MRRGSDRVRPLNLPGLAILGAAVESRQRLLQVIQSFGVGFTRKPAGLVIAEPVGGGLDHVLDEGAVGEDSGTTLDALLSLLATGGVPAQRAVLPVDPDPNPSGDSAGGVPVDVVSVL